MCERGWLLVFLPCLGLFGIGAYASVKKGVCVAPRHFLCDDLNVMDNMYWWYNWGANLDNIRNFSNCTNVNEYNNTHVPMFWGYGIYFSKYYIYDNAQFVLGFNEPNHYAQANLTAQKAADHWPEVEALSVGRKIVSPAAAHCGGSNCHGSVEEWFDNFFNICQDCRVDYLATHAYHCNAKTTMSFLKDLYDRYHLEIWLTEFACPFTTDVNEELKYMTELLPLLESAHYVFRYAWFVSRIQEQQEGAFVTSAISLLESDSSTLTELGVFYNNFYVAPTTTTTTTTATTTTIPTSATTTATATESTTFGNAGTNEKHTANRECLALSVILGYIARLIPYT